MGCLLRRRQIDQVQSGVDYFLSRFAVQGPPIGYNPPATGGADPLDAVQQVVAERQGRREMRRGGQVEEGRKRSDDRERRRSIRRTGRRVDTVSHRSRHRVRVEGT